jgi:hypothetical protein
MKQICQKLQVLIQRTEPTKDSSSEGGTNLFETSLELMDNFTRRLCEDISLNKHASNIMRLIELKMVDGASTSRRNTTDYPHLQHLRSHYL